MELHDKELLNVGAAGKILRSFCYGSLLPVGDTINLEGYDNAIQNSRNFNPVFSKAG